MGYFRVWSKAPLDTTWMEYHATKIEATRWMNSKVGDLQITILNPGDVFDSHFAGKKGDDVQLTDPDGTTARWMGVLTRFISVDSNTLTFEALEHSHELKIKRYTHNWMLANGICTASPTGGTADTLTDSQQAWTADAFNAKGLLTQPTSMQRTDTIKMKANTDEMYWDHSKGFTWTLATLSIGNSGGGLFHGYVRFPVNIPRGATIDSAIIRFTAAVTQASDCTTDIILLDYGDCLSFGSFRRNLGNGAGSLPSELTTPTKVAWTIGAITTDSTEDTDDITTLVQHFIQMDKYHPGAYIGIKIECDEADGNILKSFYAMGHNITNTKQPQLIITWTSERSGNWYTIDDTTATTLVCTGDDLETDGVVQYDPFFVGESDKTILEDVINHSRSLTASVKATTTYTAAYYQGQFLWDILMDFQLKLGYDLWTSLDSDHTLNFTDTHTASGLTLDRNTPRIHLKRLESTDEYYTSVTIIGAPHSPVFVVTSDPPGARYVECTGSFDIGALAGKTMTPVTGTAIGLHYTIVGNSENRLIVEIAADMAADGLAKDDSIMIINGDFLRYHKEVADNCGLGKEFEIDNPSIMSLATADTYADQILSDFGSWPIYPIIIWQVDGLMRDLDVGKTLTVDVNDISSQTFVCIEVVYSESTNQSLVTEYWLVKE
jgi:hypothetical protein